MRARPYPKYKPSGVEWLGEVPEHWTKTALKYTADFQNGYPFSPEDRGDSGLPIVRIAQLTGDQEPAYFDGSLPGRVKIDAGTLLFSWSASIDAFIWSGGPAWVNQHIFKTTPTSGVDTKFLFYLIKHVAPKLADVDAHGSTMRHIKKESLGERLFIPALTEQRAIADFLDRETAKIDTLVAKKRTLIERLKEKRTALISRTVTRGLPPDSARAAGLDPHPKLKPSGIDWLGDVPEHWVVRAVWHLFFLGRGRVISHEDISDNLGEFPVYSSQTENDGILGCMGSFDFDGDYITWTTDGANAGTVFRRLGRFNCTNVCGTLKPKSPARVETRFCAYALGMTTGEFVRHDINPKLMNNVMAKIRIGIPPKDEQCCVADFLDRETAKIDRMAVKIETAIERLQEYRTALITAAVTGKIDVRGAAP